MNVRFVCSTTQGILKPRYPVSGTGYSGIVESIGKGVSTFSIGDAVFGESVLGAGTNAEFVCVNESAVIARKPTNISHAEAAPVCDGAMTAFYGSYGTPTSAGLQSIRKLAVSQVGPGRYYQRIKPMLRLKATGLARRTRNPTFTNSLTIHSRAFE